MIVIVVMVIYFLFSMPRIRLFAYRLAPHSRRTRVILIGDEIFTKVGGYVLGNFLTSVIVGIGTYVWLVIFGVLVAVLLDTLLGIIGVLVAIPAAAAIRLFRQDVVLPRLDAS
jgi:predicted PurR-regulated permease PerM